MVLYHISQSTRSLIIPAPVFYTYSFGCGNLYMVDIVTIPYRFEQGIGKTKCQNVLYGFLPQIMIDAINLTFIKHICEQLVEFLRALQIMSERLLYYNAQFFFLFIQL